MTQPTTHSDGVTHTCDECFKAGAAFRLEQILALLRSDDFGVWQAARNEDSKVERWWAKELPNGDEFADYIQAKLKDGDK